MAILPNQAPDAASKIARDELELRAPFRGRSTITFGGELPPSLGAMPVFNLSVTALLASRHEDALFVGWRYVQLRPGAPTGEIVEVAADAEGLSMSSAGYAEGFLARRIADAAMSAHQQFDASAEAYEARILRLPEIHMEALWLHSQGNPDKDHFYGIPSSQKHLVDDAFIEAGRVLGEIHRTMNSDAT